jgi:hypothetical protein
MSVKSCALHDSTSSPSTMPPRLMRCVDTGWQDKNRGLQGGAKKTRDIRMWCRCVDQSGLAWAAADLICLWAQQEQS